MGERIGELSKGNIPMATCNLPQCGETIEPLEGNYFVAAYPPFSSWNKEASVEVQRALGQPQTADRPVPLGLYVHIPFCVDRCEYCYYRSYAGETQATRDRYVDAVLAELALYRDCPALANRAIDFIYFGGGTPSLLSVEQIERLLRGCQAIFPWTAVREVTFECAPKTVTERRMALLAEAGVTRISMGVQQLNDDVLRQNGRVHLTRDAERAFDEIARAGFPTINIDLIAGLVGETDETFHTSLDRVLQWQPHSVTIYQLEIPPNTPLFKSLREGRIAAPASWEVKRRRLLEAWSRLEGANYALRTCYAAVRQPDGDRLLYQQEQYRGADLVGAGVASFFYFGGVHYQNLSSLDEYFASVNQGRLPLGRAYALNDEERMVREFVLQLKLGRVDNQYFCEKFGVKIGERFAEPLASLSSRGLIGQDTDGWALTKQGMVRVDRFLPEFYLPQHRLASYW